MWYVLSSAFNKESWKRYELETKEFNTFDDARKYIRDKADKYSKFCMDEIGCDSYVEDYGDVVNMLDDSDDLMLYHTHSECCSVPDIPERDC